MYIRQKNAKLKRIPVSQMPRLVSHLKFKKILLKQLEKEFQKVYDSYQQKIATVEHEIRVGETITEFWGDIPVRARFTKNCYGKGFEVMAYGDNLKQLRYAEIYPNAHTSKNGKAKDWHMQIQTWLGGNTPVHYGGRAILYGAKSIEELMPIVRAFIEKGETPKER